MPAEAAAPRPFWSGTISFGLVAVPVDLYPANRSGRVALRMVAPDGTPLARRYFSHRGEEVSWEEIVRGAEVDDGRFVTVSDEELDALAPEKSRDIDLTRFVDAAAIDPLYFQRAYYLTPAGDTTKAYRLLAAVMEDTGRAGIATFVLRGKEYLVAIFAENGILRAATLRFADEVRSAEDVGLPEPEQPPKKAVDRLARAVRAAAKPTLALRELDDEDSRLLLAVAQEKLKAGEDVLAAPALPEEDEEGEGAEIVDLMEVIKRNLRGRTTPPARPAGRKTERPGRKRAGSAASKSKPAAKRAGGSSRRRAAPDLDGLSKSELYERAQRAGVPGRSGMSKQELIRALKKSA